MRVVIVDDEELARARLARLLGAHPDVEVVAQIGDATRALSEVRDLSPDLVLLDVRMPRHDGFDVAAVIPEGSCSVVFVTAWHDHAVRAFEAGAVDYLVKPVDAERLAVALARVRGRHAASPSPVLPTRIAVRDEGRLVFVPVAEIDTVVARGNYVELRARGTRYSLRTTLSAIVAQLDQKEFVRVHRSVVLRVERITAIEPLFRGEYLVTLADGSTFTSARGQRAELRRALGLP